jgi:hypothetical protein
MQIVQSAREMGSALSAATTAKEEVVFGLRISSLVGQNV